MQSLATQERKLSADEAAEYLGIRPQTLAIWRMTGRYSLPYHRVGRRVVYRQSDLDAFLAAGRVDFSGPAGK
jgi:excisionase family DNA binding protein